MSSRAKDPRPSLASDPKRFDERLFAAPWAQTGGLGSGALFARFASEMLPLLEFPQTTQRLLAAFSTLDVKADEVSRLFEQNPYYEHQFRSFMASLGQRESVPSLTASVVLVGMQRSRNLVLALQMFRATTGQHVPWSADGKLELAVDELLTYMHRAEEPLASRREPWALSASIGGLLFDWVLQAAKARGSDVKALRPFTDAIFAHGVRTAKVAVEFARLFPELGGTRFLYAAALVHDIGKLILAALDPSYVEFHATAQAKGLTRTLRLHAERQRFGVTHEAVGSLACEASGALRPAARAILFHHEPYLIRREPQAAYLFAALLAFSSNVAGKFENLPEAEPDRPLDSPFSWWKGPELRDFPIDAKKAGAVVARLIASGV
jgi:HD-like signal output (HDOD) protein